VDYTLNNLYWIDPYLRIFLLPVLPFFYNIIELGIFPIIDPFLFNTYRGKLQRMHLLQLPKKRLFLRFQSFKLIGFAIFDLHKHSIFDWIFISVFPFSISFVFFIYYTYERKCVYFFKERSNLAGT
jgi:hypothetical protein